MDILIVEDNKELAELLCDFLRAGNYTVSAVQTAEEALLLYKKYGARLVVLDIMLPGRDGFYVLEKIRTESNTPVLIVSAKTEKEDKLNGLNLGADDYIEKPYDIDIMLAKISGIFKRRYALDEIVDGNICINKVSRTVYKNEKELEMTAKEFELLLLLMENKGRVLSKEYIFGQVWGSDSFSEQQTLTVHIKWLRQKIEDIPKSPKKIVTVWGWVINMKAFNRIFSAVTVTIVLLFAIVNMIFAADKTDGNRQYRVEISRLAREIEANGSADISECVYVTNIERYGEKFYSTDSDYAMRIDLTGTSTSTLSEKIEEAKKKRTGLIDLYTSGDIDKTEFTALRAKYDEDIEKLKSTMEGIEQQQTMILKQRELMEDIKNAIDELINGIQYEDEYYTQILDKMVIKDKNHIDVYLKMLPHKWSFTVAKGVTGALETLKKAEASENSISEASLPTLCSEMFQIKPYADKPSAFGLSVHSFVSYERIGKWDEERYRKGGRKPYFIELGGTPRWINLYAVADADVYYYYEA